MWRGGLVLVGVLLAWALLDRSSIRDQIAERRALEARAADLTIRAIQPGSALACLDAVAGPAVEAACEKSLFASPEMVAAAVAYIDARVSLLAAGVNVAERDPSYRPSFERLRRGLEADRFGLVSHVLMTRGCTGTDCPDLKLVRDSSRILSGCDRGPSTPMSAFIRSPGIRAPLRSAPQERGLSRRHCSRRS